MATATKQKLSGSTSGRLIKVAATSSPGTLVHTATSSTADEWDEVWIWATNSDSSVRTLTIEFGGTTSPDDLIQVSLPVQAGMTLIVPGFPVQGGVVVRAFAAAANVVKVGGFVNRITN